MMPGMEELPVLSSLEAAVARAESVAGPRRVVLGIAGAPGAGKSTLVEGLLAGLRRGSAYGSDGVAHLPMDGFHLADVQLERLGLRGRKGAPETFDVDGYVATLARLREEAGHTVYAPGFERTLEQPIAAAVAVEPAARLVVTEGNYLLRPEGGWERVAGLLDEVWFVEPPTDRVQRLVARHVEFGKSPEAARAWVETVDEPNAALVASTRAAADVVVRL
jgi:pantothenate kinase